MAKRALDISGNAKVDWRGQTVQQALQRASQETVKRGAEIVAERAKELVPVKTGKLKSSIKASARKVANSDRFRGTVRTGAGYGLYVEIGVRSRAYTHTPFLVPALQDKLDEIRETLREETAKEARHK